MSTTVKPAEEKRESVKSSKNLLQNRVISGIFKSRLYPGILQWPTALVFGFIIYAFIFGNTLAHNNFGTALTWILWWPIIPVIFVVMGRFWCAICPFGTLNDIIQKFVGHNKPVPSFLKKYGIWIIDGIFILITWGDHIFGMVESPWVSGLFMLGITTAVVATAVLWQRRSWCRYLCFLGGLSSNYSQTGMLALRATPEKCSKCSTPSCYKGDDKAPGCPMSEFPRTMNSNSQCNLCGNCVKTCPNNSMTLKARMPTKELWTVNKPQFAAAFLAAVIMGIVFVQNITMLTIWQSILGWLEMVLHTNSFVAAFTVTFLVVISVPTLLLLLASYMAKKANGDTMVKNFARFGYAIIALDVAGHIAHNLFHLLAEGGYVYSTGMLFFGNEAHDMSPALVNGQVIQILQYFLIGLGVLGSLYAAYRIARSHYRQKLTATLLPYGALIVLLGVFNIILFSLPMVMRM